MLSKSFWNAFAHTTDFPQLHKNIEADVAIIGGGITGITTAQLLKEKGLSVCVLEAQKIGSGSTSDSTGNLYATIDQTLSSLRSDYEVDEVQKVIHSRKAAVNLIEKNVSHYEMDCDFKRVSMYLYASNEDHENIGKQKIAHEFNTGLECKLNILAAEPDEIPFAFARAVKMQNQAQFNPLRYVQQLANAIEDESCRIFEDSRVTDIEEKEEAVFLKTKAGTIQAKYALHATHTPKGIRLRYHTVLGPYREYGVAARLDSGHFPEGIFWGFFGKNKVSVRPYERGSEKFLLAVGQPHKVGQGEKNEENIEELISFLRKHFDVGEITHKWGGQHYRPADKLPYIGKKSHNSKVYLATGFSTDGLVYGTLSAQLISDEIAGIENPYAELYKASRFDPVKSAGKFMKENLNTASEVFKDLTISTDEKEMQELKIGEGKIISKDWHKIAVNRDQTGELKMHSAFCTHLGCIVHWNHAEKTWDCPCHGSRFDEEGCILEGPALHPLSAIKVEDGKAKTMKRE